MTRLLALFAGLSLLASFAMAQGPVFVPGQLLTVTPTEFTIIPIPKIGTNVEGIHLVLSSGLGTGDAHASHINFKVPIEGVSGSDPQAQMTKLIIHNDVYAMTDNAATNIFTVDLPTDDTGCSTHTSFTYVVTNGTSTASHSGIVVWTFVNQNGTVTAMGNDAGESVIGSGCGLSCDTWNATVAGTTATARGIFDNSLSSIGTLTFQVLNNSCTTLTLL